MQKEGSRSHANTKAPCIANDIFVIEPLNTNVTRKNVVRQSFPIIAYVGQGATWMAHIGNNKEEDFVYTICLQKEKSTMCTTYKNYVTIYE